LLVKWPGVTRAASTSAEPIVLTDLFRTLMTAAGLAAPAGLPEDGVDLAGLMREPGSKLGREALYFHYPHYYHAPKTAPASAVQVWPWKLVEHLEDGRVELFDLGKDPGEAKDLSGLEAGRVAGMRGQLERWRVEVGAAMPTLNPAFKGGAGAE
jgi:uncharacterized sulfatase